MNLSILVSIKVDKDQIQRVSLLAREDGFAYEILGSPSTNLIFHIKKFFNNYPSGYPLLPLAWEQTTPFSKKVYQALQTIPFGATRTYGEIATQIGQPKAARAVGRALATNPFPFFIPCHRIVSSTSMGGFFGGLVLENLELKKNLLLFEASSTRNFL